MENKKKIYKSFNLFDKSVRKGEFDSVMHMKHESFELFGKKILIVGFGRIGKQLIKRCTFQILQIYFRWTGPCQLKFQITQFQMLLQIP